MTESLAGGAAAAPLSMRATAVVASAVVRAARKLLTKRRAHSDRRYVYVKLTPAGTKLVASLAAGHRREIRKHAPEIMEALAKLKK